MTITYQDGTTVTWRGPAHGKGWTAEADYEDESPSGPGTAWGQRLSTWDRTMRDEIFGGGFSEDRGVLLGQDGQLSYARSIGNFGSLIWAQGPEMGWVDLDPCSQWPASPTSAELRAGTVCQVLTIDGHPVVTAEYRFDQTLHPDRTPESPTTTVFTVRPDGVAVRLWLSRADGVPTLSSEDLARAALTLPPP
ncbi:hypothetical protein CLV92_11685 [Kineococcus xinjiangensis]|uniref:Uncharacterized protein n=1 Tax=Kineococcus xinjiangensis TaxID=512762 RepID=A0A2S6IDH4_9ACTN|nr:hypothetical protein [Kineococcus xinjiangensis]PPK92223.1 hypothetical protein CLV92_11685 [Kineococcus xinjiangensis]